MNDFFLANNESLPHVFVNQKIEVKQIQVKNLERFAGFANEIKNSLESYSIETITPLIEPQILNIMGICALATTLSPDNFMNCHEEKEAIADLVLDVIKVNDAFFKREKNHQSSGQKTKDSSWFDAFAFLVKNGHRHEDIMNMPYGVFLKYLEEAQSLERQQIKSYAIATRVANNAKQQGWDKYIKHLDG
ncbi:hypothetical protein [Acinetobacter sp. NIPH 298]|uniref:hypothetical protein n=1 Tax=Acinetobacter sp. NIPH 298 TaxID=1217692 RepID=UPI0002CE1E6D|nr:hypothetical protein [Acinetobacter sp. NIPH 298]ENW95779.1 hypothetical protein F903_01541 [Acinetobacter sp. NIPH 298]